MKKILLFSIIATAFCALAAVNANKVVYKVEKPEIVLAEPPIEKFINQEEWEEYRSVYGDEESQTKTDASFSELLKLFPKGNLPYNLTAEVLREDFLGIKDLRYYEEAKTKKKNVLPREFRKFFPALDSREKFSRMPPPIGEPFLAFEAQGKHILVYFTSRGSYQYWVATFTQKGKLISERSFAHASYRDINSATLDENLNLTCSSYEVIWDKKPDGSGYKNCKITDIKLQKMTVESLLKEDSQKEVKLEKELVKRANP